VLLVGYTGIWSIDAKSRRQRNEIQRIFQQPFSWKALGVDVRGLTIQLKRADQ
jgi:hypothetical protein